MTPPSLAPLLTTPPEPSQRSHASTAARHPGSSTSPTHRRLLDIDVLAEWLATSPRHIRRLVAERRVPFVKVGHFIRFDPDDITRWIEEQKVTIDED
ncbi:MAG: helix-turn-helix domain-containing protein [Acidimicrobiales bacterium]